MTALVRGGDLLLNPGRVQEQGLGVHVRENRGAALVQDAIGRGREGQGRDHHFVARAHAQGEHGRMERGGPAGHGHAFRSIAETGHGLLEFPDLGAGGEVVGLQRLHHGPDIILVDHLPSVGQKGRLAHGSS